MIRTVSRLDLSVVAESLQGRDGRDRNGGGVLERHVGRLRHEVVLSRERVLGEGAIAPAEHLIAGLEPRHVRADCLDVPCDIPPRDELLRFVQPGAGDANEVRLAGDDVPVEGVDTGRADAHEHLVVPDRRLIDVLEL